MVFGRLKKNSKSGSAPAQSGAAETGTPETAPAASAAADETPDAAAGQTPQQTVEQTPAADTADGGAPTGTDAGTGTEAEAPAEDVFSRENGPFDEDEIDSSEGYVDLGALRIAPREGLQLRLEVEESTQRVVAVTLDLDGNSLQLQAFAAPKSEGLWAEIREQIGASVAAQGGEVEEIHGAFGTEILARLPAQAANGAMGYRVARFVGVDGPRWFLRGVFGGTGAVDRAAAADLEDLFRAVVVVRGQQPLPPRDLLQLHIPKDASATPPPGAPAANRPQGVEPPQRGPEITQIG